MGNQTAAIIRGTIVRRKMFQELHGVYQLLAYRRLESLQMFDRANGLAKFSDFKVHLSPAVHV